MTTRLKPALSVQLATSGRKCARRTVSCSKMLMNDILMMGFFWMWTADVWFFLVTCQRVQLQFSLNNFITHTAASENLWLVSFTDCGCGGGRSQSSPIMCNFCQEWLTRLFLLAACYLDRWSLLSKSWMGKSVCRASCPVMTLGLPSAVNDCPSHVCILPIMAIMLHSDQALRMLANVRTPGSRSPSCCQRGLCQSCLRTNQRALRQHNGDSLYNLKRDLGWKDLFVAPSHFPPRWLLCRHICVAH